MVPRLIARLAFVVPLVAAVAVACEHNLAEPGPLVSITVTRNPETLPISTSVQFTATGRDANGNVVVITPTWSVAAGGGAIGTSGVFTAGTVPGTFANTVTATANGISGTATAIVIAGPAASITVTPTPVTMAQSNVQQFTAVVKDAAGNVLPVSPNWSVAALGGTINGTGLFTSGTVAGTFTNTVTASVGSIAATATVTVTAGALATITVTPNPQALAIGQTQQFNAVGKDLNGNVISITPTWSVVTAASADAVTPITVGGLFKAGTLPGNYANTVKACSTALCGAGSISGFATVSVGAGALASITVIPNPTTMVTGTNQTFTAVGRDASNNIVIISPAPNWTVVAGGGAIVAGTGVFTAGGATGTFTNTVKVTNGVGGSISGFATVTVVAGPGVLATITVTPNPANLFTAGTQQFTATGYDPAGIVVVISPAPTWSVNVAVGGGTIDAGTGLFTAGAVTGTFTNTVIATSGTVSGVATVIVASPPPVGPSLGTAATYGITAGSAVTCASAPGTINADVANYPGSAITGFGAGLCTITGNQHIADAVALQAQTDLTSAYDALAAMPCGTTITADLGSTTLAEGVYCSTSSVGVTGTVTLTGTANSLFVIRAASTLTTAGNVVMAGTAQAKNVYWWVGSSATLGTGSQWKGNILALQSITFAGSVTLLGRALARNGAVDLNGTSNTITLP